MRNQQQVLEFCLSDYLKLKEELYNQDHVSDFDIDYELRFVLFLAAQIDGVQNSNEKKFINSISQKLNWSSIYNSLLLGKIEKQPRYQLSDIAIGKRFHQMGEIFYKIAYCMVLIDNELNLDEKIFIGNLKDHLFGMAESSTVNQIDLDIVKLDNDLTAGLDKKLICDKANATSSKELEDDNLSLEEYLAQLDELVGLKQVKDEINQLVNFLKIQSKRKEHKLSLSSPTLHMVFTGAPGTGKTTVARLVSKIYSCLGILKKGHLVETDRSGLVGQYMGHTDAKTMDVINSALDGVLFIDEAYSLSKDSENDFGQEAIDTLVKRMEDDRDRLVVIVAGYKEEMDSFIKSNPGLRSRFNTYVQFDNFKADELLEIFQALCIKNDYSLNNESNQRLLNLFENETKSYREDFGNGRFVRNLFEKVLRNQAMRLNVAKDELSREDLMLIKAADIISNKESS